MDLRNSLALDSNPSRLVPEWLLTIFFTNSHIPFGLPQHKSPYLIKYGALSRILAMKLMGNQPLIDPKKLKDQALRIIMRLATQFMPKPTCVATLQGHNNLVRSVAFHASLPILATGSADRTAKLWRLNSDSSAASCVATLRGHSDWVISVAFHASLPILATGSTDKTAKLWRLNSDCSAASCVATLEGHCYTVWSVAFHASLPILATGNNDRTAKLWR